MENGKILDVYVLREDEALLLKAKNNFKDEDGFKSAGMVWMVGGPRDYIP